MASWRPAASVKAGLTQATERWPHRSRAADGIIGDAAHSARRSDHNPDTRGVVHAFDLTHDPNGGPDCQDLFELLRDNRDKRLRYAIFNGRILWGPHADSVRDGSHEAWTVSTYTGSNPHRSHMHVSVGYTTAAETDARTPWWTSHHAAAPLLREGSTGADVKRVQRVVGVTADGVFGPATEAAVKRWQRAHDLTADGIVGPATRRAMKL